MMWEISRPAWVETVLTPNAFELVDFSSNSLKAFTKYVENLYDNEIPYAILNISSYGGDVGAMAGFLSVMDSYRKKGVIFCGYVSGYAMSAAAVIFLFCDNNYRFMGRFATLMFHNSHGEPGYSRVLSIKKFAEFQTKSDDWINEILSTHVKKPKGWLAKQLQNRSHDDWFLTAEEVKELGLCEIGTPVFNVVLNAEFSITFE